MLNLMFKERSNVLVSSSCSSSGASTVRQLTAHVVDGISLCAVVGFVVACVWFRFCLCLLALALLCFWGCLWCSFCSPLFASAPGEVLGAQFALLRWPWLSFSRC